MRKKAKPLAGAPPVREFFDRTFQGHPPVAFHPVPGVVLARPGKSTPDWIE